jgi:hypothetical protein
LVDEIRANRQAQQSLRGTNPSHPARLFGEAVEAESNAESDAIKRKREELQLKKLDDEIQELQFTAKRRRVENYVDCYTSLAAHGIKLDDRNKLAIKDYVDTTLMPSHANVLQDTPAKELCVRTFLMQHTKNPKDFESSFGRRVAALKRQGEEGVSIPKKQIFANGQTVMANAYFETDLKYFEEAWRQLQPRSPE